MAKDNKNVQYPIYIIVGKNSFLVNKECENVLSSLMDDDERQMAMRTFEADKATIADVLDELRTLPFLASKRVVLLRDADKFISNYRQQLENYFDAPSKRSVLVMTLGAFPKTTKLAKKAEKTGCTITVQDINKNQLAAYAISYAKQNHNKKLDQTAAQLIVDRAGDDAAMVCGEVDKLVIYVGDNTAITPQDVSLLCGNNREFDIFEVIDQVSKGNTGNAIERLRNMFSTDKDSEYTVIGALAFHFRRMFKAKAMLDSGIPVQEIIKSLRIWSDKDSFFAQLRKWQLSAIASVIEALARIDFESKTGKARVSIEVEQLIMKASLKIARR